MILCNTDQVAHVSCKAYVSGQDATEEKVMSYRDALRWTMHEALRPGGRLLKITWHGPHRSAEESRDKIRYRYDGPEEPTPEALIADIERAGFVLSESSILECGPATIGWDAIQVCLFRRAAA